MSAALTLVLILVASVGLSACGGDDEPAASSDDGFERVETEGASVEVPGGWEDDPQGPPDEGVKELLNVHGPEDDDGMFVRISLFRGDLGGFKSAKVLGKSLTDSRAFELREGRVVADSEASVDGADDAWRVVTEFTPELEGGDGPRSQITELVAARGKEAYILAVAGPKRMIDDVDVERVLGSLRLG